MTCDGRDIIVNHISIPEDIKVGDWLCWAGMGSYTIGPKSNFNGMPAMEKMFVLSDDGDLVSAE